MKLEKSLGKLLTNKMVLNVVSIVSLLTIIGYLTMGQLNEVFMFILLSIVIYSFNKNMILVLGIPLLIVVGYNVLNGKNYVEGMVNKNESSKESNNNNNGNKSNDKPNIPSAMMASKIKGKLNKDNNNQTEEENTDDANNTETTTEEAFAVTGKKGGQYNIDYASTVEDAYSDLNKILDGEGIKRLTGDTQKLMKQQMMLAESMKNMEPMLQGMAPLLKQAETLLGNMNNGSSSLGGLADLAKKFSINLPTGNK